jgi:hypothetical protein
MVNFGVCVLMAESPAARLGEDLLLAHDVNSQLWPDVNRDILRSMHFLLISIFYFNYPKFSLIKLLEFKMFKRFRNLKNEIENKLIKKEVDMDRDLEILLQRRKKMIAVIQ